MTKNPGFGKPPLYNTPEDTKLIFMKNKLPILPSSTAEKIGFNAILKETHSFSYTPYGKEYLSSIGPSASFDEVEKRLSLTKEWLALIQDDTYIPLEETEDVMDIASESMISGGRLALTDFLIVRQNARLARLIKGFFNTEEIESKAPGLQRISSHILSMKPLEKAIEQVITDRGELKDNASPELQRIRKQINRERNQLRNTIQRVMRRVSEKGMASDEGPTIRSGRMVIPILVEFKRKVNGFIHDISSTGNTVYLEPIEALQINNDIRHLQAEEEREIERIIMDLTSEVRTYAETLIKNTHHVGHMDAVQSMARMGKRLEGSIPHLTKNRHLQIFQARNPNLLLKNFYSEKKDPVVSLDLELLDNERGLIITGPNAGGKSVAMKTTGLLSMMLQFGLPVPAAPHSVFPVISGLFMDMGDDQSIENDLSTFSSRLNWMKITLEQNLENSLVMIDEAGSGTDPDEGSALFQAFVEIITARGARVIVTTHHGALKVFAQETESMVNGAMEFNQQNLSPTYHFKKGVPGSSYAFEIADRLHVQPELMKRARELLGSTKNKLGDLLTDLERKVQQAEIREQQFQTKLTETEKREAEAVRSHESLNQKRDQIIRDAYKYAGEIMKDANRRIEKAVEKVVSEGRENKEAIREARKEVQDAKKEIFTQRKAGRARTEKKRVDASLGDTVTIGDSQTRGEVIGISGKNATVLTNGMKIRAKLTDLKVQPDPVNSKKSNKTRATAYHSDADLSVKPSLDLRGKRGEESLYELTQYLDRAVARGLMQVEIVHGKGDGILQKLVHQYLGERAEVESFDFAPLNQGGSGCTIVQLV